MKLKRHYLRVVEELGFTSLRLVALSDCSERGFSEKEFFDWLKAVCRFLRVILKRYPSDLIRKV